MSDLKKSMGTYTCISYTVCGENTGGIIPKQLVYSTYL